MRKCFCLPPFTYYCNTLTITSCTCTTTDKIIMAWWFLSEKVFYPFPVKSSSFLTLPAPSSHITRFAGTLLNQRTPCYDDVDKLSELVDQSKYQNQWGEGLRRGVQWFNRSLGCNVTRGGRFSWLTRCTRK